MIKSWNSIAATYGIPRTSGSTSVFSVDTELNESTFSFQRFGLLLYHGETVYADLLLINSYTA